MDCIPRLELPTLVASIPPRRRQARYRVTLSVTMTSDHNFYVGTATNLSGGGLFVATTLVKAVGERVDLGIELPCGRQLAMGGIIRWVRKEDEDAPAGMGIELVERGTDALVAITDFLGQREPAFIDD